MSGRFVRASKYPSPDGVDLQANPLYISVNWESSGGGAFAVIPLEERGRIPEHVPLFRGHTAPVLDTDWSPFNDSLIASGSDDGKVFIWTVPEGFSLQTEEEEPEDISPVKKFTGHSRKVGHVLFNPAAENILASSSGDFTIKLWDVETGASPLVLRHTDIVQSLSWSANGALLVTTCRDKKLRVWDVRQQTPVQEVNGHQGAKNSRVVWMGEHDRLATTGFSKMSDRQLGLWDIRAPIEPLGGFQVLDSISGVCMPFWDEGTQCLYLAGKGDGNIRYFEYTNDKFEFLSEYKSADPQRGLAFLPKRGINVHENEVMRAFKTINDSYIEPISFIVPRRAEVFQTDIYPPTTGSKAGVSSAEWLSGKEALPPKIDLESVYAGEEAIEVPLSTKTPASQPAPSAPSVIAKKEPLPVVSEPVHRSTPPNVKDQASSIASIADKYADKSDPTRDQDDEKDYSFDQPANKTENVIPKTVHKNEPILPAVILPPAKTASPPQSGYSPIKESPPYTNRGPSEPIESSLKEIKSLLEAQSRTMTDQTDQISRLTAEVDTLKTRVSESASNREKDERIRQLELELEQSRSS
ncbi:MAG: Coronin-like protein crn1 [Trizodia sp. TS-e1964]|nr:MAG: Coronin-like protein crn1 [Trizodia sp. TS-e1964]